MTANSPEELQKQVEELKKWIDSQPNFPKDLDKLLKRFLHSCYYDMEKTKKTLEVFVSVRASAPELLTDRDPSSPHMQQISKFVNMAYLPVSGNRVLWLSQITNEGLQYYDHVLEAKLFFLLTDALLLNDDMLEDEDIVITDAKNMSWRLLTKFNMSVARKMFKYQQEGMPIRLKQVHVVNAPWFMDKLFALMRPFMKQELTEMIQCHTANSDTLYKFFDREELPEEFGGTNGKMEDHNRALHEMLISNREKLMNDELWRSTTTKSKNKTEDNSDQRSSKEFAID